jgi:hypothetical protein
VSVTGDPPLSYQWRLGGSNLSGATSNSFTIASAQTSNAGSYDVIVANSYGSATSAVATLTVRVPPSITSQPMSLVVTQGANATFNVTATGNLPLSYQWRLGGSNLSGATSNSFTIASAQASNAGNYDVIVSNGYGSVTSAVATLTVYGELRLNYQLLATNGSFGLRIFVPSGQPYSLEASSNLTSWLPVFTNQSGASGNDFIEPGVTNSTSRFFRGKRWP